MADGTITVDVPKNARSAFRLLVAACNRLAAETEEYHTDDGAGRWALLDYWHEFDGALEDAKITLEADAELTNPTPVCYRWKHVKDEVWKYGSQPKHLVPPRGKTLLGYYQIEPLYSEAQVSRAGSISEDAYRQLMKHAHRLAMDGHGELAQHLRDAIYGRGPWESNDETA